ncbi:hypothetical protein ACIBL6_19560 [Streptomyces sp. NPDC050400]|uniref:hypothetical protein n=1 Tax=Streptomyces sp. NPDC050400 TaxID=3365610 RepID=UPI003793E7CA
MKHPKIQAGIRGTVLAAACALAGGLTAGTAHASDWGPYDGWSQSGAYSYTITWTTTFWPGPAPDSNHAAPAVVTSWSPLAVRDAPTPHATATSHLRAGAHIRLFCQTTGEPVQGTSTWYFDHDAHGWVSAAYVHPTHGQPPDC